MAVNFCAIIPRTCVIFDSHAWNYCAERGNYAISIHVGVTDQQMDYYKMLFVDSTMWSMCRLVFWLNCSGGLMAFEYNSEQVSRVDALYNIPPDCYLSNTPCGHFFI